MNVDQKIDSQSVDLDKFDEEGGSRRNLQGWNLKLAAIVAISWSLFQLWYASPLPYILDFGKIIDVPARSLHFSFWTSFMFFDLSHFKIKKKIKNINLRFCLGFYIAFSDLIHFF